VLIVDDVRASSLALEVQLQGLDCTLLCADSGNKALSLLLRESFAVMLLDVRMPGMDGYEVARHVRMHAATRQLPIIFMTAASPDANDDLRLGYDAGAVDFLFKPINRQVLRSKVRVFLELYCSRRELADANQRLEQANARLLALVDAEASAARALRQANDDLGIADRVPRAARSQLLHTAGVSIPGDRDLDPADGDRPTDYD
jgi:CheY-like chemotaxis protein